MLGVLKHGSWSELVYADLEQVLSWSWASSSCLGPAHNQLIGQLRSSLNHLITSLNQLKPAQPSFHASKIPNQHMLDLFQQGFPLLVGSVIPTYVTLPAASVVSIVRCCYYGLTTLQGTLRLNTVSGVCVCVCVRACVCYWEREEMQRDSWIWSEAADGFQMWSGPQVPHV